jgi:hypothetical protein
MITSLQFALQKVAAEPQLLDEVIERRKTSMAGKSWSFWGTTSGESNTSNQSTSTALRGHRGLPQ